VFGRAWHALVALLVITGLILQVWIAVDVASRPPAHAVGTLAGTALFGRLVRVVSFFTIQSNILSLVVSAQLVRDPARDGRLWRIVRLAALFGITVTGIVYSTVLAAMHEPHGWRETTSNAIFHYIVPLGTVLGWLLFGPRPRVAPAVIGWALVWPVVWFAYTLVHGAASGWYPYPFVDVATQGYGRVLLNAVAVTAVFAVVGVLFAWLDRRLPAQPASARTTRDGLGRPN
jgi:uncharacterized membrane protein